MRRSPTLAITLPLGVPIALAAALLEAPAPLPAQETAPAVDARFGGVAFPDVAADFTALRVNRWPDPALGIGITYTSPNTPAELTVYVYPVPDDAPDDYLKEEFDESWQTIRTYAETNRDGVEVELGATEPFEVTGDDGVVRSGWRGDAIMRRGPTARTTLLYLFEKDGEYIKYRMTYERASSRLLEPRIMRFLVVTLGAIAPAG